MRTRLWCWVVVSLFPVALQGQDRESLIERIVEEPSWEASTELAEYGEEEIELLIGNNVRAVQKFGLIGASQLRVEGPEGSVRMTLFEMIDSTAAFGLFTLKRDWRRNGLKPFPVGAGGYRIGGELVFWQSKYVIQLVGSNRPVEVLARILSTTIVGQSAKPPVSRHLPPGGLVHESEQYIIDPITFENSVGLKSDVLGFNDSVEVAVAHYKIKEASARLVMLLYPTQQLAKKHTENWLAITGSTTPYKRSGPLVAIIQDTTDRDLLESLLSTVYYESQVTWNEALPDPLTLPHLILTIFSWIGIAIAFTVVVGVGFGGFRVYMKTKYPNHGFGNADDVEFIQLKINQSVTSKRLKQ